MTGERGAKNLIVMRGRNLSIFNVSGEGARKRKSCDMEECELTKEANPLSTF